MNKVLLISEQQIKDKSVLEQNIDPKIVSRAIMEVQDLQLFNVLGKDLYATVMDAVYNAATDDTYVMDTGLKELLSDYIQPYLVYEVLCDFIMTNNYKLTNKGTLKYNDQNATSLSNQELDYARSFYTNKLAGYKSRLVKYLRDNKFIDILQQEDETGPAIGWFLEKTNYDPRWVINWQYYGYPLFLN